MSLLTLESTIIYPSWNAPAFVDKPRKQWTKAEATEYLRIVRDAMIPRSDYLLTFFDVDRSLDAVPQLREAQARAQELLKTSPYSVTMFEPGTTPLRVQEVLTLAGESVAIDLGLLLSKHLLAKFPERIHWAIGGKPKSDINYNLPVLAGVVRPSGEDIFDPISFAIGKCTTALVDAKQNDGLAQVFEYLSRAIVEERT
jgi:hypothetical protein